MCLIVQTKQILFELPKLKMQRRRQKLPSKGALRSGLHPLFYSPDLTQLVLSHLSAEHLCICSMVCTKIKDAIDTFDPLMQVFANDLRWWGSPCKYDQSDKIVPFHALESRFHLEMTHTEERRQLLWRMHMIPMVNMKCCMRMELKVSVENAIADTVVLSGNSLRVKKCLERKHVSIDVIAWKVTRITHTHNSKHSFLGPMGSVSLCAIDYISNDPNVTLMIKYPIVVTLHDVPVDHLANRPFSFRGLWVMRNVINCMHCHQRTPSVVSCDVETMNHGVLCTHCWNHLYVKEPQLARKWRINPLLVADIRRAHFCDSFNGFVRSMVNPTQPYKCLLKSKIAQNFGHASWTSFIQNNYKSSLSNKWGRKKIFYVSNKWF